MKQLDLAPDSDLDAVAQIAVNVAVKIRDEDPRRLYDELVNLCRYHPAKAAQLVMVFAAWFDPDTPLSTLWRRVSDITKPLVGRAS